MGFFDWVAKEIRIALAIAFMLLSIAVDFTSAFLSRLSDGLMIGVALVLLMPILKGK